MKRFLQSLTVTTRSNKTNTSIQSQLHGSQTPFFTTTSTPKTTTCGLSVSTTGSIYDPNGSLAPVTLRGKQTLLQMCKDKLDWDSPVPEYLHPQWEKWRREIVQLEKLEIQRCFKPDNFGPVKAVEVHYFSDASVERCGQCFYLRLTDELDQAHCSFIAGKARVAPLNKRLFQG